MREIIIVGYQSYDFAGSLIVGEVKYFDFHCDLSCFDALILTSKNALYALLKNAEKYPTMQEWVNLPSYVIGEGSAKAVLENGGNVKYIAKTSIGSEFAKELIPCLCDKNVFFPHAKRIVSNLDEILLSHHIKLTSQVAYEVLPKEEVFLAPKEGSILLFTSPSAYRFFIQKYPWKDSYTAVALGKTTLECFSSEIDCMLSPFQNIQKAFQYLQNLNL